VPPISTLAKEGFMAFCEQGARLVALELPAEFEDLDGLIQADLQAVVAMLAQRAHERLFLTRREFRDLQASLWNGLADAVNAAAAPLSVENR
jgi:hypothetical protein